MADNDPLVLRATVKNSRWKCMYEKIEEMDLGKLNINFKYIYNVCLHCCALSALLKIKKCTYASLNAIMSVF